MRENTRLSVAHLVRDPCFSFVILVFVGLFLFIILPLGKIFAYSVTNNDGRLSFQAAWDMLKSRSYLEPLKNSMLLGSQQAYSQLSLGMSLHMPLLV